MAGRTAQFSLPQQLKLTTSELEFLSEDEEISIIPSLAMEKLYFISGSYGPFQPPAPARVPLWLALSLKKLGKCKIVTPPWMRVAALEDVVAQEKALSNEFQPIPYHTVEIANQLMTYAADDVENADRVRMLLEDLTHCRHAKIRANMVSQDEDTVAIELTHMCAMEVNLIRDVFGGAMEQFAALRSAGDASSSRQQDSGAGVSRGRVPSLSSSSSAPMSSSSSSAFHHSESLHSQEPDRPRRVLRQPHLG